MKQRLIALLTLIVCGILLAPSITHAADVLPDVETVDPVDTIASIRLDAATVTILIGLLLPILTGLVTKLGTSSWVKGLIHLVLQLITAAIVTAQIADGSAVWSQSTLITALISFGIAVATYLGIYQNANLTSSKPEGKLAPSKGI